jgi:hypothetical protein
VTIQPVSQRVSPLRQRMLEDTAMRGLRQATQRNYLRSVQDFAAFLKRPPDTATPGDIRRYQVHQAATGVQPQSINCSVSALRFYFTVTIAHPISPPKNSCRARPRARFVRFSPSWPGGHETRRVTSAPCRPTQPVLADRSILPTM